MIYWYTYNLQDRIYLQIFMYCMGFCWKSVGIRLNGLRFPMKGHSESRGSASEGGLVGFPFNQFQDSFVNQSATQWLQRFSPVASHKDDLCRGPPFAAFSGFAVLFPGQFRIRKGRQDLRRWEWDQAKHLLLVLCPILCVCYDYLWLANGFVWR